MKNRLSGLCELPRRSRRRSVHRVRFRLFGSTSINAPQAQASAAPRGRRCGRELNDNDGHRAMPHHASGTSGHRFRAFPDPASAHRLLLKDRASPLPLLGCSTTGAMSGCPERLATIMLRAIAESSTIRTLILESFFPRASDGTAFLEAMHERPPRVKALLPGKLGAAASRCGFQVSGPRSVPPKPLRFVVDQIPRVKKPRYRQII